MSCPVCLKPVVQQRMGRRKKYCSSECKTMAGNGAKGPCDKHKPCLHCGVSTSHMPPDGRRLYCSSKCGEKAAMIRNAKTPPEKSCSVCEKIYQPYQEASKYCGKDCRIKASLSRKRARTVEAREGQPDKTCPHCEASFRPEGTGRKYCSRKCLDSVRLAEKLTSYEPSTACLVHIKACTECGQDFCGYAKKEVCSRQCLNARTSRYNKRNPNFKAADAHRASLRRAILKRAVPMWASLECIKDIFKKAKDQCLSVDHMVPLNSKLVCGLHCEDNMQLLTRSENSSKNNRYWPNMWETL